LAGVRADLPVVLLAHQPHLIKHAVDRVDLQISGHTHGAAHPDPRLTGGGQNRSHLPASTRQQICGAISVQGEDEAKRVLDVDQLTVAEAAPPLSETARVDSRRLLDQNQGLAAEHVDGGPEGRRSSRRRRGCDEHG
jgi:hypothetical protein